LGDFEGRQVDTRFVLKLFLGFVPNTGIKRGPVKFGAFWFWNYENRFIGSKCVAKKPKKLVIFLKILFFVYLTPFKGHPKRPLSE